MSTNQDKTTELNRYNSRSQKALSELDGFQFAHGSESVPPVFRTPYITYEEIIKNRIKAGSRVLELGSGTGLHTRILLETGADVVASDIAPAALELLKNGLSSFGNKLSTQAADMEALPFEDGFFDFVTSAGSLSYGDLNLVTAEILRVLKKDGVFMCVDSFNHNPIYKFNRYIHYLRGERSLSTLNRMPSIKTLEFFKRSFKTVDVSYSGIFIFAGPLIAKIFGQHSAKKIIDALDRKLSILRKYSFKIVIIAGK